MAFDIKGSLLRVSIDTKTILHEIDFSYGQTREFQELSSKDDEHAVLPGKLTYSLSGNGYADNSTGNAQEDISSLFAWSDTKTSKAITIADGISGNISFSATAYLETLEIQSTVNEVVTYSFTMRVTDSTVGTTA